MENYATIIKNREMEKIANPYDKSEIIMSGNGFNRVVKLDSLKTQYLKQSKDPILL